MIYEDIQKAVRESIIAVEGVILVNTNDDRLIVKVFPQHDFGGINLRWVHIWISYCACTFSQNIHHDH